MSEFNKTNNLHFYFLTVNICKHNACKPFLETCFPWKNSNGYICCEWSSARGQYIKKVRDPIKGEQILNCGKTTFYLETKAIIALLFQLCEMNLCYCLKKLFKNFFIVSYRKCWNYGVGCHLLIFFSFIINQSSDELYKIHVSLQTLQPIKISDNGKTEHLQHCRTVYNINHHVTVLRRSVKLH